MWDLACKYYTPHLRNKSLTKKVGAGAGWLEWLEWLVHCGLTSSGPWLVHGCVLMWVDLSSAPCTLCCMFGEPIHALRSPPATICRFMWRCRPHLWSASVRSPVSGAGRSTQVTAHSSKLQLRLLV